MSSAAHVSLFSLASSSVPKVTSVSAPRFSRVSFTLASIHTEGRSWRLEATAGDEKKSVVEEKISEAQKGASDLNEAVKEKASEINEDAKDNFKTLQDKTEEGAGVVTDKSEEASSINAEKTKEASKAAEGAWEAAQDKAEKVKEAVFGKDGEK